MGNYRNRYDDVYWETDRNDDEFRNRGLGYSGMRGRERTWDERPVYYGRERQRESYNRDSRDESRDDYSSDRNEARMVNRDYSSSYGTRPATTNRYYERTYRPPYYGRDFDARDYRGDYDDRDSRSEYAQHRGWWDRASDEVAAWFGDEEAVRRRRQEKNQSTHRGRGPKDYRRSDERIREDINDRLTDNEYLDAYDVHTVVNNGEVILSGTVSSRSDKRLAEDVAESVSGVNYVQNQLRVGEIRRIEDASVSTPQARAAKQV